MAISQKEFAAMVGVTPQAISKAVKAGRLTVPLDPVGSLRQWDAGRAPPTKAPKSEAPATAPSHGKPEPEPKPKPPARRSNTAAPAEDDTAGPLNYNEAKTKETTYKARLRRLEYEERSGSLVNAVEVKAQWQELAQGLRTRLMSIPQALAPRLASMTESHDIRIALDEAIRQALQDVADDARRPPA